MISNGSNGAVLAALLAAVLTVSLPLAVSAQRAPDNGLPGGGARLVQAERRITAQQAQDIAAAAANGRALRAEVTTRNGRPVYAVLVFREAEGLVRTVYVDAETGNVL